MSDDAPAIVHAAKRPTTRNARDAVRVLRAVLAAALAAAAIDAAAATVETFSPQGELKGVRQVAARFSAQMVPFGDPRVVKRSMLHAGERHRRWADGRNWVFDFARDLPAASRARLPSNPGSPRCR